MDPVESLRTLKPAAARAMKAPNRIRRRGVWLLAVDPKSPPATATPARSAVGPEWGRELSSPPAVGSAGEPRSLPHRGIGRSLSRKKESGGPRYSSECGLRADPEQVGGWMLVGAPGQARITTPLRVSELGRSWAKASITRQRVTRRLGSRPSQRYGRRLGSCCSLQPGCNVADFSFHRRYRPEVAVARVRQDGPAPVHRFGTRDTDEGTAGLCPEHAAPVPPDCRSSPPIDGPSRPIPRPSLRESLVGFRGGRCVAFGTHSAS